MDELEIEDDKGCPDGEFELRGFGGRMKNPPSRLSKCISRPWRSPAVDSKEKRTI